LTNDGDLANKLMHPRFGVEKTYLVQVAGKPERDELAQLLKGVWLSDGHVKAKRVKRLKSQGESAWLEIVLSEGKNREIRRLLADEAKGKIKDWAKGKLTITVGDKDVEYMVGKDAKVTVGDDEVKGKERGKAFKDNVGTEVTVVYDKEGDKITVKAVKVPKK